MAKQSKKQEGKLQKVEPARVVTPFEDMERFFDNVFARGWLRPFGWERPRWGEMMSAFEERMPKVDVIDREEEVVVRAEVPGVSKDDLDVTVSDNTVTIRGETRHEEKEEKGDYYRSEMTRGSFARTVLLPSDVDADQAKAKFSDGVLELTLPKVEKAKKKTVKID
jgi:HSP20 family protein